ncbi:MAG: serine hydrolase [Alphaproteobacteria bacterium]|nr:serine hydrolase [Alphaproteobacteria bacterium]
MDRRTFLIGMSGLAGAAAWSPRVVAAEPVYHVVYPGSTTREEARDFLEAIAGQLGPDVAAHLQVARSGDAFVVIYDRSGVREPHDKAQAVDVARRHDDLLRAALDEDRVFAAVIGSDELTDVWNIRYGAPGTKADLQARFDTVARMLGDGVAKALVIEQIDGDVHQLVYKRMGDQASTDKVAAHHASLLRRDGIGATAVPDAFFEITFDGSSDPGDAAPVACATAEAVEAVDTGEAGDAPLVAAHAVDQAPLGEQINDRVQDLRRRGQVSSVERTAWVVYDLVAEQTLAAINADRPMQAASMIKPFVALAFFHQVSKGRLVYGSTSTSHVERMIRDSSNTSTNWVMKAVGGPAACQRILDQAYGSIARNVRIVEYIPAGGCTYRNLSSGNDYVRLLKALWHDDVPYAKELRRVMNLPGPDRLFRDVPDIPAGTEVYNKTGTTAMCCGDMGILVARSRGGERVPYILVGIIERSVRTDSYTAWQQSRGNVIRAISGLTYRWLKPRYDLA